MTTIFPQAWLEILCKSLPETHSALFVMHEGNNENIHLLAKWPEQIAVIDDFEQIIKYARLKNEQVSTLNVHQADEGKHYDYFALPVILQSELIGTIVFKVGHLPAERHDAVFKTLQQSVQWLALAHIKQDETKDFYALVIRLLATCLEQKSYRDSLIALTTEMTQSLNCERVAIGEFKNQNCKVVALSNSAQFDERSNFVQKIADAMDEAIEQDSHIVFPNPQLTHIQRAHQELTRKFGSGSLLTIPMLDSGNFFGALTLFRSEENPFNPETVKLCKLAVSLLTPYLALKKNSEQGLIKIATIKLKKWVGNLVGFKNLKTKLAITGLACLILASGVLHGDFQLTADAVLEGKMQRVIAAPIEGFLLSASARAGDTVKKGDLMANLDDDELQLELNKLNGQLQKFRREYREALSTGDLVKVRVISAQIDQATAEMELTQQQLQKIALTAPFDSVVIEGDLSQMLGSPVQRGDVLFKIAPLEGYRVILKIDERLISFVKVGQKGILALSSLPERKFNLKVQKITAVAEADNKKNIFRVEASLDNPPDLLRPGMEGIGKINAGRRSLLWIWTHDLVDWLRLWIWSWSF